MLGCGGSGSGAASASDGATEGETDPATGGTAGASSDGTGGETETSADTGTDTTSPPQEDVCPPTYMLPMVAECDGSLLLEPANIAESSPGVLEVEGPDGADAFRLNDEEVMWLADEDCLRLGQDGEDFSVSMWFRLPEAETTSQARLFGTGNSSGSTDGFSLHVQPRAGGLALEALSGGGEGTPRINVNGPSIETESWNHVVLTYRNGTQFEMTVNGHPLDIERPGRDAFEDIFREGMFSFGDPGHGERAPIEVSQARAYKRALSDGEIRALYLEHASVRGLSGDALGTALDALSEHFAGNETLGPDAFSAAVDGVTQHGLMLSTRQEWIEQGLDLIDAYEAGPGPLFLVEDVGTEISQAPEAGESDAVREARGMLAVHQAVFDYGFNPEVVAGCGDILEARSWQTSSHFPGAVDPGAVAGEHTVVVDATKPAYFGRPVAFATEAARRPTGLYLPPGSVGTVSVPAALVGKGYTVLVGAHTHKQDVDPESNRGHRRLPNAFRRFEILQEETSIANPLGGGVYITVPYLSDAGLLDVTISGVVEAPIFSLRSFDTMTPEQWQSRRNAPGPWVDFVSDRYMMQVPRHWVDAIDDPTAILEDWDRTMDGFTELFGWEPQERNDIVLYMQVDVWIRHGMGGIGYPQINATFVPGQIQEGSSNHFFLTNPTPQLDLHELGHAQLVSKFRGEEEALVNFPMAYVLNEKFGVDFDEAFGESSAHSPDGGDFTPDEAAVHWMVTANFRTNQEMDYSSSTLNEIRYQHRGYAKYADVARLFGWEALRSFYRAEHLAEEAGRASNNGLDAVDDRILRMSIAAGADLTPLIHFWGIHPVGADDLSAAISAAGIESSSEIEDLLRRYRDLIPADNDAFNAYYLEVYPGQPKGGDPDFGHGWFNVWSPLWNETHAEDTRTALDQILTTYYP